ncbi:MAG: GMP synthase (glutamine-hydrolyzing), partial [Candidatus Pacebacteria bacterium CG10_big_fil_rev_8_21_14_0_10_42_12]
MSNKVAILDAGAQYGKVIDRRVRELGVESEIIDLNSSTEKLREYSAIIISGGPVSVNSLEAKPYNEELFELGIP